MEVKQASIILILSQLLLKIKKKKIIQNNPVVHKFEKIKVEIYFSSNNGQILILLLCLTSIGG